VPLLVLELEGSLASKFEGPIERQPARPVRVLVLLGPVHVMLVSLVGRLEVEP
jgi:hypothetical protein